MVLFGFLFVCVLFKKPRLWTEELGELTLFYSAEKKRGIKRQAPADGLQAASRAVTCCSAASLQSEQNTYACTYERDGPMRQRGRAGSRVNQESPN